MIRRLSESVWQVTLEGGYSTEISVANCSFRSFEEFENWLTFTAQRELARFRARRGVSKTERTLWRGPTAR